MPVRTRFAPSPTGYLHIGGVRTALFNWLFARHHGGQFILRIDDTDQQRNIAEALAPILDGLRWLGIDWDEGPEVGGPHEPYYQSQRRARHHAAVVELLHKGLAYFDFAKTEEIQAERQAAEREKRPFVYSRRWMAETDARAAEFAAEGREAVVRLQMPREGRCRFTDLVRGEMQFDWAAEQDHVIQRPDGSCLYHLASVVDDHDFEITHVIRAVEHLSNTPRQIFIAQGLGYDLPQFAHLPFVAEPGGTNKLSKRKLATYLKQKDFKSLFDHGAAIAAAVGVDTTSESFSPVLLDFYLQVGYLPEAIINYLLLLGWSLDDKTEDFSREEMIGAFTLDRVVKSPASFDPQKLLAFQARHMQRLPVKQKTAMVLPYLQRSGLVSEPPPCDVGPMVRQIVEAAGDRIKVAGDILQFTDFFTTDDQLTYDDTAFTKRLGKPEVVELLRRFRERLASVEPFDAPTTEAAMQSFIADEGVAIGAIIHPLRVAVTGKAVGFGMFDTLAILGRDRCLARIDRAVARAK